MDKDWDWTIEATGKGFYFIEMECVPAFGGGRYTKQETELAYIEFNKIDNPDIPRTQQEGIDLIESIKNKISKQ